MEVVKMAYPVLTGAVLIEANGAALNNAGLAEDVRTEQTIVVKSVRVGRLHFPYVSGQAWRRWWREVLYADFGWKPSPMFVSKKPQQAFTKGDPITYEEDDLFGYMAARKRADKRSRKSEEEEMAEAAKGTNRRISPLKNSLLISVLPNVVVRDFAHLSRHQQDTQIRLLPDSPSQDPLLWGSEHYTTYLQGVFTISLSDVGRFVLGEMADLSEDIVNEHKGVLQKDANNDRTYWLPKEERIRRVKEVLLALARLRGGAHLARNLSDVTPVVVLVGFLNGGNAPFQRIFEPDDNNERVLLNLTRLRSVLEDYQDRLLVEGNDKALFFGYRPTVLANEVEVLEQFQNDELFSRLIQVAGTPQQALERAAEQVESVFGKYVP
jgi:CRISPR-associated protein Cst2